MTDFNQNTLDHLRKLCRIECTDAEKDDILRSLNSVLAYIEQLNEVNTDEVKPCTFVLRGMLKNPLREDEPKDLLPRDRFLANAPDQIGGMVRVPPVLKAP